MNTPQNIGTTYEGLDNIYNTESTLLSDLSDFNQKYIEYINCEKSNCSTLTQKQKEMQSAYDLIINTDIPAVNNGMPTTGLTPSQYDMSFNSLLQTHTDLVKTRIELDKKMKELNKTKDSNYVEYKNKFESTMYINILFAVLATSILYFTFAKI